MNDQLKKISHSIAAIQKSRDLNPLIHVVPHEKQAEFLRLDRREAWFFGANSGGKSFIGAYKAACYLTGSDPLGLIPHKIPKPSRIVAGIKVLTKGWLGCKNLEKGVEIVKQNLIPLLPKDSWTFTEHRGLLKMKETGASIKCMSYETESDKWGSDALDFAWLDEQCPWDKYQELRARTARRNGKIWAAVTPLDELSPWTYWEIIRKADAGDKRFGYVTVDYEDNWYLTPEQKQELRDAYEGTEEETARLHGRHAFMKDIIHSKFNHAVHVIDEFPITDAIKEKYRFVRIFDLHPRQPSVLTLAMYKDRPREVVILAELAMEGGIVKMVEFKRAVNELTREMKIQIECDIMDTPDPTLTDPGPGMFGAVHSPVTLLAALAVTEHYEGEIIPGIAGIPANRDKTSGIKRLNDHLRIPGAFKVVRTCRRHIRGIEGFRWDNWRGRRANERGAKEQTIKKDDHEVRNIHYLMMYLRAVDESKEELEKSQKYAKYGPLYRRNYQSGLV